LVDLCGGGSAYVVDSTEESAGPPYCLVVLGVDPSTGKREIFQQAGLEIGDEVILRIVDAENWELEGENGLLD